MNSLKTIDDFPWAEMIKYDLGRAGAEWIKKLRADSKNENVITWIIHFFQIDANYLNNENANRDRNPN